MSSTPPTLHDDELETYGWQIDLPGFGEEGQRKLKQSSILVSRVGGLGSPVAMELAAAGVGKLVLAHGGNLQPSDLNRQLLMSHDWLGKPRVESAAARLKAFNPRLDIVAVNANLSEENARELISQVDLVVDCAPMFGERFAMHDEAHRQGKPVVEAAMYGMEATLTTVIPGQSSCLRCRVPEVPKDWKRRFPVFGAVSGAVGCLAAMEAIKVLCNFGQPLSDTMLCLSLDDMSSRRVQLARRPNCPLCGTNPA
jgi:molybdopterin-synthase adenylyltransferase